MLLEGSAHCLPAWQDSVGTRCPADTSGPGKATCGAVVVPGTHSRPHAASLHCAQAAHGARSPGWGVLHVTRVTHSGGTPRAWHVSPEPGQQGAFVRRARKDGMGQSKPTGAVASRRSGVPATLLPAGPAATEWVTTPRQWPRVTRGVGGHGVHQQAQWPPVRAVQHRAPGDVVGAGWGLQKTPRFPRCLQQHPGQCPVVTAGAAPVPTN